MQENFCKNCGHSFAGKFCNLCGEKVYSEKDKKLSHLLEEAFHFITHFEGTFFTSLKTILTRPGKLSLDFCNGIRKKYFRPLSFFLLLVILYLLFPLFEGLNMRLHFYTVNDVYGNYAMQKTQQVMQRTGMNFEQLSEAFHYKGEKISKFLLFIIIPFMALFSWLVGYQKRKYYYDHFIFSTEAASFFLLLGFLIFPVLLLSLRALTGSLLVNNESYIAGIILFALLAYLVVGARKFFNFRWWYSLVYALLFTGVLAVFVNYVYKLILFFIAISQI